MSDLVIKELQNRIGQIVSNYELQMANLKAEAIQIISEKEEEINSLKAKEESKKS